ncbi:MAG: FHA domain-containing protein [Planctomycetes bacterium]|nr:FHA domain-containing protein [Planctomycetota bacterium]
MPQRPVFVYLSFHNCQNSRRIAGYARHVLMIGRSIETDLRLFEDTAVSRIHCVISLPEDTLIIEDRESTNGTRVNGRMVFEPTELRDGDSITVGATELKVRVLADGT